MQEGKRQKQISALLYEELSGIFQRIGLNIVEGGMISISSVKITPDLLEVRVYLSMFQVKEPQAMLQKVEDRKWEIKRELTARVGKQLRRMPELHFYIDDTLEHAFKIESLLKKIQENPGAGEGESQKSEA